jgi:hypothetical protein
VYACAFALFTFLSTHISALCVYARSCFISSSSPCPVLCLSAIHRCRHTTLIFKRQTKCVNLSINLFIHSFILSSFFLKKKPRPTNSDTITNNEPSNNDSNHQKHPKTIDQSSVTDESSFGSCEPGTSVVLEGIVWNETDKGIDRILFSGRFNYSMYHFIGVLVVNITWRGTYFFLLLTFIKCNVL